MAKIVRSVTSAVTGAVAAAGAVYYLDSVSGRRRRAQLGERSVSAARRVASQLRRAGRDLGHRMGGLATRALSGLRPHRADARVLAERVRSCLGRVVSHPGAIHVSVEQRRVVLRGAVLAWEHGRLRRALGAVSGIEAIQDELSVHESAEHVSSLQGHPRRQRRGPELLQPRWSPGTRLLMAVAGGGLLFGGSRHRGALGVFGAAAGGVLLLRSVVNAPLTDLARGRRREIEVRRTLRLRASVERVFATLSDPQNLLLFMPNITEVRRSADGGTHWRLLGPLGIPVRWDAVTTQLDSNRLLAWRTTEGSPLQHWGMLRFERTDQDGTRLHVYLRYSPPTGRLGHAVGRMLGADARSELDQALTRLKAYLESGSRASDGPSPGRAQMEGAAGESGSDEVGVSAADPAGWTPPAGSRPH